MQSLMQIFSTVKTLKKIWLFIVLLSLTSVYLACSKDIDSEEPRPFLNIDNGFFEVETVIQEENSSDSSGMALGSGSLSFTYTGDINGTFFASGPLVSDQTAKDGVGAIITLVENVDFETFDEGFSLLAFHPTGDGKADVFILGTKYDSPLTSLKAGDVFGIGPLEPFNGLYLNGIDIIEFWKGEKNFIETADIAFVLTVGVIQIATRDSTHIRGSFFGTTHANPKPLSKPSLLR